MILHGHRVTIRGMYKSPTPHVAVLLACGCLVLTSCTTGRQVRVTVEAPAMHREIYALGDLHLPEALYYKPAGSTADLDAYAAPMILQEVINCLEEERVPDDEHVYVFMQKFFRVSLLTLVLLGIELAVIFYFLASYPVMPIPWLPLPIAWLLLAKNIAMLVIGYRMRHGDDEENIIDTIRGLPAWVLRWERIGYLLTALGFIALFYVANLAPAN